MEQIREIELYLLKAIAKCPNIKETEQEKKK